MRNNLKKFGLSLVLLFLIVGFSGCKKSDSAKVDNGSSDEQVAGEETKISKEDDGDVKSKKEIEKYCKENRDEIEKGKKETSQAISNYIKENNISVDKDNIEWTTVRYDDLGFEFKLPKNLDEHIVCEKATSKGSIKDADFGCSFRKVLYLGILKKKQDLSNIDDFLKFLKENKEPGDFSLDSFYSGEVLENSNIYGFSACGELLAISAITKDYIIFSGFGLLLTELGIDVDDNIHYKILKSFKKIE